MRLSLLSFSLLVALPSCVVSTHEGVGVAPVIPLKPETETVDEGPVLGVDTPAEIGASHILISYQGAMRAAPYIERSKPEAKDFAEELRKKALAGDDFGELAKAHSDDRGSAAQNGSLGRFTPDKMVPEFSRAAFVLDVGGVSDVTESPFGFHVIRRDE